MDPRRFTAKKGGVEALTEPKTEGLLYKKIYVGKEYRKIEGECGCALTITDQFVIDAKKMQKVLDEAKQDLYNTEDELTEEWFAERDSEFHKKIMDKIEKWFGEMEVKKE